MPNESPAATPPHGRPPNLATRALGRVARYAKTGDPAATLDRFFDSKHVNDLRTIIFVSFLAVLAVLVVGIVLSFEREWNEWQKLAADPDNARALVDQVHANLPYAAVAGFLAFFGPVLGVFFAVVAWAYQAGSARLGVVDLFACEISTLCRVGTILDTVLHLVEKFDRGPPAPSGHATSQAASQAASHAVAPAAPASQFVSQEDYFPVFENNTKDLQSLEAGVVINITAFYTYMKAVRDSMRALAEIRPASIEPAAALPWRDAMRSVIYLLYLGFESARKAIADLVEFEPDRAERTVVVLISELTAYGFLRREFSDEADMRCKRLRLREPEYERVVAEVRAEVEHGRRGGDAAKWEPAWLLLPELHKRQADAVARLPPSPSRPAAA